jgi:hypothetical protein
MLTSLFPELGGRLFRLTLVIAIGAGSAAASTFFVATNSQANYRTATGVNISYNSNTGATQTITNDGSETLTYSGSPNETGLTSAFDQSTMLEDTMYGPATGSSYASANLATGIVRAQAAGDATIVNGPFGVGVASAEISDTLTFTIAGAGPTTVTDITVYYNLDGTISTGGFAQQSESDHLFFGSALTEFYSDTAQTWASANFISSSPTDGVFEGVYALVGSTVTLNVDLSLSLGCEDGCSQDFTNTSQISLSMPSNVSFTSASGVFLTQTTPEPSSWAMLLIGSGCMLAGIARRRRHS